MRERTPRKKGAEPNCEYFHVYPPAFELKG
jgi:hypothetical protein